MIGKLRTGLVRWCRKFGQRRNREDCLPSDHTGMYTVHHLLLSIVYDLSV